jgi:hypothetical protein
MSCGKKASYAETYLKETIRKIVGPRRNLLNVHNRASFGVFSAVTVTELTGGQRCSLKLRPRSAKTPSKPETVGDIKNVKYSYKGSFLKGGNRFVNQEIPRLYFKLLPCFECRMLFLGYFPASVV